jgi:hypothetical protein
MKASVAVMSSASSVMGSARTVMGSASATLRISSQTGSQPMKKVIALSGRASCGKTTTIRMAHVLLLE